MSLDLFFLGGNYYSGEVLLGRLLLFQAWNILGQNGLFLFSLLPGLSLRRLRALIVGSFLYFMLSLWLLQPYKYNLYTY